MLKKEHISGIKVMSDEWKTARLAKLTSSVNFNLMGETPDTIGAINYIRRKVGEEMTGVSAEKEFESSGTAWGVVHEATAVTKFGLARGYDFIIVQQLVVNGRYGSTPDGIIVLGMNADKTEYDVETLEVKCPETFDAYIGLFECETPAQLKKYSLKYYIQVLDQMLMCGARKGYFVAYQPLFRAGNMRVIEFILNEPKEVKGKITYPLHEDYKLLKTRKLLAEEKFDEIRSKLIRAGKV